MTHSLVTAVLDAIVLFLLASGAVCFAVMVKGTLVLRRMTHENPREDNATLLKSPLAPSVSMIVAPEDGSPQSRALVRLLVGLHFGKHEVVLVLDGPDDADLAVWTGEFRLAPSLRRVDGALPAGKVRSVLESRDPISLTVIVQERSGPALALNAAVNAAQSAVVGWFGPECVFPPEALLRLIPPMLEEPQLTIAVCGVAPAPAAQGMLAQFESLDFVRGWLSRQAALSAWNVVMPVAGAAMLITRESVLKAGGFRSGVLELFLRVQASKQAHRVAFVPQSGCYPRAARSLAELREAAAREQETMASALSMRDLPWWLRGGILTFGLLGPLLETVAYILTAVGLAEGWVGVGLASSVLLSTVGLGMLLSMAAVSLRELAEFQGSDPARLTRLSLAAIAENLGFRQGRNLWLLLRWSGLG